MAPRGRSRKVGLRRIDAAMDAMSAYGFPKELVRRRIKQLLKVYGGDEGFVFIQEANFSPLLEYILEQENGSAEEEETGEDDGQPSFDGPSSEVLSNVEPSDAEPIGGVHVAVSSASGSAHAAQELTCSKPELMSTDSETNGKDGISCLPSTEGEGSHWRDIVLDKHSDPQLLDDGIVTDGGNFGVVNALIHLPEQAMPCQQPEDNPPKKRRRRCNGWISNDDEEYALNYSSLTISPSQFCKMIEGTKGRKQRKSRWDVRPEDP